MNGCAPSSTPLPAGLSLSIEDCPSTPEEVEEMAKVPYREALGAIMWLQVVTRPDLSYAINVLSRFAHNPGKQHWNVLKHVLSYIKGTSHYGITYKGGGSLTPVGYIDSDYAGCCYDLAKQLSYYLYFFSFLLDLLHRRKCGKVSRHKCHTVTPHDRKSQRHIT